MYSFYSERHCGYYQEIVKYSIYISLFFCTANSILHCLLKPYSEAGIKSDDVMQKGLKSTCPPGIENVVERNTLKNAENKKLKN